MAKAGAKLRCSVCKEIFRLEESAAPSPLNYDLDAAKAPDMAPPPKRNSRKGVLMFVLLALVLAIGAAGAWRYFKGSFGVSSPQNGADAVKNVEMLTMRGVRQYYVDNEKVGRIFVVEGKVVNGFPAPKEFIQVEAALYGPDKKPLVAKTQMAGAALSLFQLQVLGEKELENFLHNKIEILTHNTNVPNGGEVPFMVLFYAPPANVAEFGVRIVDAKDARPSS